MRNHQRTLPMFVAVACAATLIAIALGSPAAAQPAGLAPTPAVADPSGQFTLASQPLTFTRPATARSATLVSPNAAPLNESFEGSWPTSDWQLSDQSSSDGGTYLWGKRNCTSHTGQFAIMAHGGGAQGSGKACGSQYPNNLNTWAVYGPVNLSNATAATLYIYIRGHSPSISGCSADGLFIGTSTNSTQFSGVGLCGGTTSGSDGNGYTRLGFDLASLLGKSVNQPQVWIGFVFYSDASGTDIGYTLDDLTLEITTSGGATNTPTATAPASPTATRTPTTTPGNVADLRRFVPIAIKVPAPTSTPTPTTTASPTAKPSGDKPKDGHWAGKTTQNEDVEFDILSNGSAYNNFSIGARQGGCGISITIMGGSGGLALSNGKINLSGGGAFGGSYTITGQFSSPQNASGSFSFQSYNPSGACGITASGSWTASIP
ncbi:MAG TPA: hypothetical protein PKK15_16235 [Kouleothrix sp.]|nr:hypothetical protein [Kouleothrix sp.]